MTNDFQVSGLSMSYIVTFDLGSETGKRVSYEELLKRLSTFATGLYIVEKSEVREFDAQHVDYLKSYYKVLALI